MLKLTLVAASAALLSALPLATANAVPLTGMTTMPNIGAAQTGNPIVEKITYFRYSYGRRYYDRPYYSRSYFYGRSYGRRYH
jgi:hypothetical protein